MGAHGRAPHLRCEAVSVAVLDEAHIRAAAAADGILPVVTNKAAEQLGTLELLQIYKYQSFVEKRHEQLKTAAEVMPVNYKSPERIGAFLFLYFVAVTIHALSERQVRTAMKKRRLRSIPLEDMASNCRASGRSPWTVRTHGRQR